MSMIVVKKEKFLQKDKNDLIDVKLPQLESDEKFLMLEDNKDCCYMCIDKLILVSAHLSSKPEKNLKEAQAMKKMLKRLKN